MSADTAPLNLTNHFLIAMPGLQDATFSKSVVYVCEHSERGALGLVINKPSDINLKVLFVKVELPLMRADLVNTPVFHGGADVRRATISRVVLRSKATTSRRSPRNNMCRSMPCSTR